MKIRIALISSAIVVLLSSQQSKSNELIDRLSDKEVTAFDLGMFIVKRDLQDYLESRSFHFLRDKRDDIIYSAIVGYNPRKGEITLGVSAHRHPASKENWDPGSECSDIIDRLRIWAGYYPREGQLLHERSTVMDVFYELVDGAHNPTEWQGDVAEITVVRYWGNVNSEKVECSGGLLSSDHVVNRN